MKTLEEEAKKYAENKLQRIVEIYNPLEGNVSEYVSFIAGATSKYVQIEKLKAQKDILNSLKMELNFLYEKQTGINCHPAEASRIMGKQSGLSLAMEYIRDKQKKLEQQLKELENGY